MKQTLFILISISVPVLGQQKSYMDLLPRELQLEVVKYVAGATLAEVLANLEKYYAAHPSAKKDMSITKAILTHLIQKFNLTTGEELQEVVDKLNKLPSMTIFQNAELQKWIDAQKKQLFLEQELRDEVLYNARKNVKKVKELIAQGVNVNARDKAGETPLINAVTSAMDFQTEKVQKTNEIVKALLAAGADVNAQNKWGKSALSNGISFGLVSTVQLLLDAGANPNTIDVDNHTPLTSVGWAFVSKHEQSQPYNKQIMKMLLEKGANPNQKGQSNKTIKDHITDSHKITAQEKAELIDLLRQYGLKE